MNSFNFTKSKSRSDKKNLSAIHIKVLNSYCRNWRYIDLVEVTLYRPNIKIKIVSIYLFWQIILQLTNDHPKHSMAGANLNKSKLFSTSTTTAKRSRICINWFQTSLHQKLHNGGNDSHKRQSQLWDQITCQTKTG